MECNCLQWLKVTEFSNCELIILLNELTLNYVYEQYLLIYLLVELLGLSNEEFIFLLNISSFLTMLHFLLKYYFLSR